MKKALTGIAWCKDSPIRYYLLTEELENGSTVYGTSVAYLGESAETRGLTFSYQSAVHLLDLLCRGTVTPVTARDVVMDWLIDRNDSACNF